MAKITKEMVENFNQSLETMNCSFKLRYDDSWKNPQCEIVPSNTLFINSAIINPTKEFYQTLDAFFKVNGIELSYNNTRDIFWSISGYDEE